LMRLCVRDGAPAITVFSLLRKFMRDCVKRGYNGYIMHIDPTEEKMRKMIPICRRAGGVQLHTPQVLLAGKTATAGQF
jgi:hypothetical protein